MIRGREMGQTSFPRISRSNRYFHSPASPSFDSARLRASSRSRGATRSRVQLSRHKLQLQLFAHHTRTQPHLTQKPTQVRPCSRDSPRGLCLSDPPLGIKTVLAKRTGRAVSRCPRTHVESPYFTTLMETEMVGPQMHRKELKISPRRFSHLSLPRTPVRWKVLSTSSW